MQINFRSTFWGQKMIYSGKKRIHGKEIFLREAQKGDSVSKGTWNLNPTSDIKQI